MENTICKIIDIHYAKGGLIRIFARTSEKRAIILKYKFNSYFYVKCNNIYQFESQAKRNFKPSPTFSTIIAKGYDGFNDKQTEFIKITFNNDEDLKRFTYSSNYKKAIKQLNAIVYEADIDPKLRFIHETHVDPSGYICINLKDYSQESENEYVYINNDIPYLKYESTLDIPMLISSFDIECDSVTGSFPLAKKSWLNFFKEVFQWFNSNIYSKNIIRNKIFKVKNNREAQYANWNTLMDIILDENYFKLSIGANILKLIGNDHYCHLAKQYMMGSHVELHQEVINLLDTTIIPAIDKTLTITNLRTREQLVDIAIKILHSGLPHIDIDPVTMAKYTNIDRKVLENYFDIGFKYNFNWKISESNIKSRIENYPHELPKLAGDEVIQIGTVSQWSNEEFPVEKAIFMIGDCEPFDNNELIDLENNDLQKEHTSLFPEKELDVFLKSHNINPPSTYDEKLTLMKEYQLNHQHDNDKANVHIYVFTKELHTIKPIVKIIAKEMMEWKNQKFEQLCESIYKKRMKRLDDIIDSCNDVTQSICDKIAKYYKLDKLSYTNQTLNDIAIQVARELTGNMIEYKVGGEPEMLEAWANYIYNINPDVITGYNIFSFDYQYMEDRKVANGIKKMFGIMSRIKDTDDNFTELTLSSSALGDNILKFPETPGRVLIDMYKFIQKDYALDSYKLDDVSTLFLYKEKANVPPQEIFRKQHGNNKDRKDVAMYCILDCILPINLMLKLDVLQKNCAMSNVCKVPMNFLFTRGQGIKLFSLVLYYAHNIFPDDILLINTRYDKKKSTGYEGAIVFDPVKGFHTTPTAVGDFNSLYPNSMIAYNISHDTIIDKASPFAYEDGTPNWDLLEKCGYETDTIEFNDTIEVDQKFFKKGEINKQLVCDIYGITEDQITFDKNTWLIPIKKQCVYVKSDSYRTGLMPEILKMLLKARKDIRKKIAVENNPFHKNVLDTMQLAYKITANSLYGQTGASTSKIFRKEVAASTTAIGRMMVNTARAVFESLAGTMITIPDRYDNNKTWNIYIKSAETRAGDTDSCMTSWACYWDKEYKKQLEELDSIWACMNICKHGCDLINNKVRAPEHIEFEKVICPFAIFAKKRYHGHYYVDGAYDDPYNPKFFKKSMGIVLKRRDNAHLLKDIYSKCLDILMNERDLNKSFCKLEEELMNLDQRPMDDFVITKTLKTGYKLDNVAHVMLAARQAQRDPGNRFETNDRIPYVYFYSPAHNSNTLQGDRIETPEYMIKYDYPIDYAYYIDKQLKKPLGQIFCDLLSQNERFEQIIKKAIDKYKVNKVKERTYRITLDYQSNDEEERYVYKFA